MSGMTAAWVLLLSLVTLLPLPSCQSLQAQNIVITSVTGCTDQGRVTIDCPLPANLRIRTTGLPPWTADDGPHIRLRSSSSGSLTTYGGEVTLDSSDPTGSTALVSVSPVSWNTIVPAGLVNISFVDISGNSSAFQQAFAFRWTGPPVLTSISGCEGGGQSTLNCVPDETVLTVVGSGLSWLGLDLPPRLNMGGGSVRLAEQPTVVNDSYATVPIYTAYATLLRPSHYNGSLLNVSFTLSPAYPVATTSNVLYVSFGPQPPPSISLVVAYRCNGTASTQWRYVGCVPGLSYLQIIGDYIYEATATVGGLPCVPTTPRPTAKELYCSLPYIADSNATAAYDLTVSNEVGTATVQALVQYIDGPSLNAAVPCLQRGLYFTAYTADLPLCAPTSTLVMRGTQLPVGAAVEVTLFTRDQATLSCSSAVVVDASTLRCTLPALDSGSSWYQTSVSVQAQFAASSQTTNLLSLGRLFFPPPFPFITSVSSSSCVSLSPLQLAACQPGAVITIRGANLNTSSPSLFAAPDTASIYTADVLRLSNRGWQTLDNDSLTYELPAGEFDTQAVQLDVAYDFVLYQYLATGATASNSFVITFTSQAALEGSTGSAGQASSGGGLSGGSIAGIVIGVLVVGLVLTAMAVYLLRLRSASSSRPSSYKRQDDGLMLTSTH